MNRVPPIIDSVTVIQLNILNNNIKYCNNNSHKIVIIIIMIIMKEGSNVNKNENVFVTIVAGIC